MIFGCNKCKHNSLSKSADVILGVYKKFFTDKKHNDNAVVFYCKHGEICIYDN